MTLMERAAEFKSSAMKDRNVMGNKNLGNASSEGSQTTKVKPMIMKNLKGPTAKKL